jgi:hypothetical protein
VNARATLLLLASLLTLGACATDVSVVGAPDAARDVSVDAPGDLGPADVPAADDRPDVPTPDLVDVVAPGDTPDVVAPCTVDGMCAGDPAGAVCDTGSGRCVQCLPSRDTCDPASHCDAMSNRCVSGCRADEGCAPTPGVDGGFTESLRCDTTRNACVECARDEHCAAGFLCVGNLCAAGCSQTRACPTGQSCCGGACVDGQANTAHCGACDRACRVTNASPVCLNGRCAVGMCTAPFEDCDGDPANGCEVNTLVSATHCGACSSACPARANSAARCEVGRCAYACEPGFADCDGDPANGCEVDLRADPANCGRCASRCDPANGTGACRAGVCAIGACAENFADCDGNVGNGCEADTRTNATHCGRCANACPAAANAFPGCLGGRCVTSCVSGFLDCDGDDANGCEADIRRDLRSCGACGRACAPPRGTGACEMGVCRVAACDPDALDCNGRADDGCEVTPASDVRHCGMCGRVCTTTGGTPACVRGGCTLDRCAAGRGDCDGDPSNGCEVDVNGSQTHCGACGRACAPGNATGACDVGVCRVAACATGFGDCDGVAATGCEVDLRASTTHCGVCNRGCAPANAEPACAMGACAIGQCRAGFGDCNGSAADGCETNLAADLAACGACGRPCATRPNTVARCDAGACAYTCAAGFADCDGDVTNGCEVDTRTSATHCGACGRSCSNGPCVAGVCQCGNGRVDTGEECDLGGMNSDAPGARCRTDCRPCGRCGSGREGAFRPTTSTTLAGGAHDFTEVVIPSGVTVTVTGTEPLRIHATGAVEIAGALLLNGGDGGAGTVSNEVFGVGGAGGGGGGRAGGRGGWFTGSFIEAVPGSGPGGGGAPPESFRGAGAGGGGGGYSAAGVRGADATCCRARIEDASYPGGPAGASYGAQDLAALQGGSGGGGGDFGRADNGTGGGGGGGGGAVQIIAPSIRVTGRIAANGGRGGDAARDWDGGGGGGGSGGAIALRAVTVTVTGSVEARGGTGGTTTVGGTCCIGGAGGRGADGRVVVEAVDFTGATAPAPFRAPPVCRNPACG